MDNQPVDSNQNQPPTEVTLDTRGIVLTGLSGNELFCLELSGYNPGNILLGNSVYSLGFVGGVLSNLKTTLGGELHQVTEMISEGRRLALERLEAEIGQLGASGATGISSDLIFHPGNVEFVSMGSAIYSKNATQTNPITSSSDGQEFYCQIDSGYMPWRFVFGNVAYSLGFVRNFVGQIKGLRKGEIPEFSNVFETTRNLALQRITDEAKEIGANSVVGIRTTILPISENNNDSSSYVQEMVMAGTASFNDRLDPSLLQSVDGIVTSDLTTIEMWNITRLGYVPMKLLLGTSVYSLGVIGGVKAAIKEFFKGEVNSLTQMLYGAREESLKKILDQAKSIGAEDVLGIKTYVYHLGGDVIEFLAIGTAVKKVAGITTRSDQLPPQAIIRDKSTFINISEKDPGSKTDLNKQAIKDNSTQNAPSDPSPDHLAHTIFG